MITIAVLDENDNVLAERKLLPGDNLCKNDEDLCEEVINTVESFYDVVED